MIDIQYINNGFMESKFSNPVYLFEKEMEQIGNELMNIQEEYMDAISPFTLESEITGIMTEANKEKINEEKSNVLAKLGKLIKTIVKKILELADKLIDKIKNLSFSLKSNEKKMDQLIKQHPELSKEKIQILCEKGGLDFSDLKSFSSMDKAFNELKNAAKNDSIDEKSFRGKYEKFASDVRNERTGLQTAAKVAGAATVVIGLYTAVKKAKEGMAKADMEVRKMKKEAQAEESEIYRELSKEGKFKSMGKYQLLLNAYRLKNSKKAQVLGENVSLITKLANKIAEVADKATSTNASKAVFGDVSGNFKKNKRYEMKKNNKEQKKSTDSKNKNNQNNKNKE